MKKYIVIGLVLVVVLIISATSYWYVFLQKDTKKTHYKRDPNAWVVPPVAYSMKGKTFTVPEQPETNVTLNLVAPSVKYDYPMAKFNLATGTGEGQLYAMDDFTTELADGLRAVPIVVANSGTGKFFYLAIIKEEGDSWQHISSVYLGDRINITSVTRNGSLVTVVYNTHDRNQPFSDIPTVSTSAVIDINNSTFVQEGRKPWLEADLTVKEFKGKYLWIETKRDDTIIKPSNPEVFTLLFDGPRATLGTDCNTGSSELSLPVGTSSAITFGSVAATKKFCQSSEEGPYFEMFGQITEYREDKEGQITFKLKDGGEMLFIKEGQKLEFENSTSIGSSSTDSN